MIFLTNRVINETFQGLAQLKRQQILTFIDNK